MYVINTNIIHFWRTSPVGIYVRRIKQLYFIEHLTIRLRVRLKHLFITVISLYSIGGGDRVSAARCLLSFLLIVRLYLIERKHARLNSKEESSYLSIEMYKN